jgi:uncharacterized repeat protein (TIGR01451 family)
VPVTAAGVRAESGHRDASAPTPPAQAATGTAALSPVAPGLTATKVDSFSDPDGDGKAEPGQTITYTVTIANNGASDASGVVFSDTVDPQTTLVGGSVQTQPVASNDSYNVLGNVRIQPGVAQGLLANDCDPDNGSSCSSAGLTASGPSSSEQGGNVSVNPDGSFSYNPPAGFEGTDSFAYTVTDATGKFDTAVATLTVNEVVWFVDDTAPAGGDGRLSSPYNSLAPLGGPGDLDEPGDCIFVHKGSPSGYGGGIVLEDGQRLVGQGTSLDTALASFGIAAPPHSDARPAASGRPTLANAGGNVITLANGNTVLHLNAAASAPAATAIFASGTSGTTTVSNAGLSASGGAGGLSVINALGPVLVTGSAISCNSTGTAVLVNGGTSNVTLSGTSVSQNGGRVVYVHNRAGGVVHFDGTSTVTGTNGTVDAVTLEGNAAGSTVTFAASIQLNTSATGARGLVASGAAGFTLNVTGGGNAVSSTGGAAVDVQDITANVTFSTTFSTDSNGGGLRLHNASGSASFGNTAITGSAGTGVSLTDNSAAVSFSDLDIAPAAGQRGLHATNNTGTIGSTGGEVSTVNATAVEITGASAGSRTPLNMMLASVSAAAASGSNPPNGIVLINTHGPGAAIGFSVVGDNANTDLGGNSSGGSIVGTAGADGATSGIGVRLENADEVSLRRMTISHHPNFAVLGTNSSNFTLAYSTVNGTNGVSGALSEGSLYFENLTGAAAITSCLIEGGLRENLNVVNSSGTLNRLDISGSTFGFNSASGGNNILIESRNPGTTLNFTLQNSTIKGARVDWINAVANSGSVMDAVVNGNTFDNLGANAHPSALSGGNRISVGTLGTQTVDIRNNTLRGSKGEAIRVRGSGAASLTGTVHGRIRNNIIGNAAIANSGSVEGSGIFVFGDGGSRMNVAVTDNQVRQYNNHGINMTFGDEINDGSVFNVTVTGNVVNTPGTINSDFNAIHLNNGTVLATDNFTTCADIGGAGALRNSVAGGGKGLISPNNNDIRLRQRQATTVRLPGYVGATNDNAAVASYLAGRNNAGSANAANSVPTGGGYVGGTACAQPSFASLALPGEEEARQYLADAGAPRQPAPTGYAGAADFSAWLPSLNKIGRGLAYSERAQALRLDAVAPEAQPETPHAARAAAALAAVSGETINVQIGTLRAGDSVTITFKVTVADPFTGSQPQVSNQGSVTDVSGLVVRTDDPDAPGAADPTVTQLLLPPTIDVNDGMVAEPATGTANALFTVTLSHAYTHPVTVNFSTSDGTATAGDDYAATSGSVSFAAGQTVQTVSVPVLFDAIAGEGDETFLVNLSNAQGGVIADGQAIGTIRDPSVPSPVIISELRTSGPAGSGDDFVELLNTTDSPITVVSSDNSAGWSVVTSGSDCSQTPIVVGVVPNGTVIPARGNYLLTGSAYSLGAYAAGDAVLTTDIEDDRNVGLFTTAELSNISSATLYDAVGFGANEGNNCDLLREGTNLPAAAGSTSEYSFVRKVSKGLTVDTGDNSADFVAVSTTPSLPVGDNTPILGAPGPEGLTGPSGPVPCSASTGSARFGRELIDQLSGVGDDPNFVRSTTPDAQNNSALGTLDFRRTFTNNTGAPVTALRFRVIDLSTFPVEAGTADLRARSSSTITVLTGSGNKTVRGTTLEAPAQPSGGGVNSTLAAGTITPATPLPSGASVNLRFLFGVEQTGDYDIAIALESSPGSGKDFWRLTGHTESGGHTERGCNRPPVANAGADQTAECSSGEASVTLDGSASSDPDGDAPLTYEWSENGNPLGTGQSISVTLPLGSHTVTLKVTDPSGDSSQDTVTVSVVDTTRPVVTAPPAVVVYTGPGAASCGTTVGDEALGTASAADACQGPGLAVSRSGVPAGNFFPVGTTTITYSATDAAGNTGTATQSVTVVDNTAPAVAAPADISVGNDPNSCSAVVNPGEATATDNCNVVSVAGTRSDNQPLTEPYPVGTTTITWTAIDAAGNTATATQTVTVQDTQAPAVNSSVAVTTMGPSFDHPLINVGLAATATDNCPGLAPVQVSVYSDEDDGAAPHSPDASDIGLGTLKLRRERAGNGNGRVYLIVVKATDARGNTSASCGTVTVPLSSSASHISAVNAQAAAAASFCSANNGAAPSGFYSVGP